MYNYLLDNSLEEVLKMTKIDIFSGFLGSGKTTLIKKLIKEAYQNEKLVLIENEFGEIGIDGSFMKEAGIEITEMNSGCICCSLVGDFGDALRKVLEQFSPDRILIEPSGVGKLSDVIKAVSNIHCDSAQLNSYTTVVDVNKCKMYMKNFGEFFNDQIENASTIILSHTQKASEAKIEECVGLLRNHNSDAVIVTTAWDDLDGKDLLNAMQGHGGIGEVLSSLKQEMTHSVHHHDHDEHCDCDHEHHHDHDEHCNCDHEHHHHDHDEQCNCGHEHHHHSAHDVFDSWGVETAKKFEYIQIKDILENFAESEEYGIILRAKGILASGDGQWIHFDYIPGEGDVRFGSSDISGKICVIGSNLNKKKISELFDIKGE